MELLLPPPVVLPPPLLPELLLPELLLPELLLLEPESLDEDAVEVELSLAVVEAAGVDDVDELSELPGLLDE